MLPSRLKAVTGPQAFESCFHPAPQIVPPAVPSSLADTRLHPGGIESESSKPIT
jgi:hypothetical protein